MTRLVLPFALALSLLTSTAGAAPAADVHWWGFQTPSHNIVCNSLPSRSGATVGVVCVVFSASPSWGQKGWMLARSGRPSVRTARANIGVDVATLGYGRAWQRAGLRCVSQATGLTCRNPQGHGFSLSRQQQ